MSDPKALGRAQGDPFRRRLRLRERVGRLFRSLTFVSVLLGLLALGALLFNVVTNGRLLEAMHSFAQAQQVTLALRAVTRGAEVTTYARVAKALQENTALQVGDVIVTFLGRPVRRSGELWQHLLDAPAGALDDAELRWIPREERLFGELASERVAGGRQVRVEDVAPGSPGEAAGLRAGDVIRAVAGQPVERGRHAFEQVLLAKLADPGPAPVSLEVERDGAALRLELDAVRATRDAYRRDLLGALWHFVSHFDSRYPEVAGMVSAIFGSVYIILLTAAIAFPLGVGAAIYLEEYAPKGRVSSFINVNIANLAGVPSVVYGIIGLELFARGAVLNAATGWLNGVVTGLTGWPALIPAFEGVGRSVLAGAMTLALLILPIVIINAREALKAVPGSMREAAYGVGATRWQVVRHHVLPYALPGVFTGVILAMSRAIGETAPLILLGAFLYVPFLPGSVFDVFTVMPMQIFSWTNQPQDGYPNLAAAAILVLLGIMLVLNALAIVLRNRLQVRW